MSDEKKDLFGLNSESGPSEQNTESSADFGIRKPENASFSSHDEQPSFPSLHKKSDPEVSFPSLHNQPESSESPSFPALNAAKEAEGSRTASEHSSVEETTSIMAVHESDSAAAPSKEPVSPDNTSAQKKAEPISLPHTETPSRHAAGQQNTAAKRQVTPTAAKQAKAASRSRPTGETLTRVYQPVHETPEETLAREKQRRRQQRKQRRFQIVTAILVLLVACELIVGITGFVIAGNMIKSSPNIAVSDFIGEESSKIYDDSGNVLTEVGTYYRENITYDKCPESLIDAFLAIEDSRFFTHFGFDIPRFTKALIENLRNHDFGQGGSTFTMQLVKNTYFSVDAGDSSVERSKTIEYKVQQIWLAIKLEKMLSKKEIFQLYLNKLNFGGRIRGVQKASLYYFGKNCTDLTLTESAMLAGIVNLPNGYNPYRYLDSATTRRNEVLYQMENHGYITSDEYDLAKSVKVEDELVGENYATQSADSTQNNYQSYIDAVLDEAEKMTGQDPTIKGMQIYTYMNKTVQDEVEAIQAGTDVTFPNDLMQCAMISMNNKTGAIVAIGGGRNYNTGARLLNRATSQFKQPGSSVKPVLSYALAFEYLGYSLDEILIDKPITYPNESMVLVNATGTYAGDVTIKDAVAYSLNIPAILTLEKVQNKIGKEAIVNYMNSVGFTVPTVDNFHLSFAIGGTWFETTCEELAGAHSMLLNGGVYNKPHTISKIVMTDGTEYYPQDQNKQVLSAGSAYLSCQLMYNNVYGSVYNYMQILKRDYPVYAKTGTSDWGKDGLQYGIPQGAMKDKWMVASTSQYTNAVWIGYDMAIAGKNTYINHSDVLNNYPGQINKLLLDAEDKVTDVSNLQGIEKPSDVEDVTYVNGTYPHVEPEDWMDSSTYITSEVSKAGLESQPLVSSTEYKEYLAKEITDGTFGITAAYDSTGAMSVTWGNGSNSCAGGQKNVSLHDQWGNNIEAWGACLADLSWLTGTGGSSYWATVYSDDTAVGNISSENGYYYGYVGSLYGTVKVCGGMGTDSSSACVVANYLPEGVTDQSGGTTTDSNSTGHVDANGVWVDDGWWDEAGVFHHY